MKWRKNFFIFILSFINMFILNGCWDYKETEKLDVMLGVAIDKDTSTNEYILTGEIAFPSPGDRQSKYSSKIYTTKGRNILEATELFITKTGRRPFWSNTTILILNKRLAEEDITNAIELLSRENELRGDLFILISNKNTAKEILQTGYNPDVIRSIEISYALKNQKNVGIYPKTQLSDISNNQKSSDSVVLIPLIDIVSEDKKIDFQIMGSAILKRNKVIGYLKAEETQAAMLIKGDIKHGLVITYDNPKTSENIAIKLYNPKVNIKSSYANNELELDINIKSRIDLEEINLDVDLTSKEEEDRIKLQCENTLKNQLSTIVNLSKEHYKTDIFGIYQKIEADHPSILKKANSSWNNLYLQSKININVHFDIRSSKLITNPLKRGMK